MPNSSRKLAAIVFTDIAGFTELSARDELKSIKLLENQRRIFQPIVSEFGGQWLKEMGDGLLLSFESSLNAVRCAVELQMASRGVEDLDLRIGIHQGDIVLQGTEILGDGVNIASRIEPLAPVGGVALSEKIQQDISSHPELTTKLLGRPDLKGVTQQLGIYCLTSHGLPEGVEIEDGSGETHAKTVGESNSRAFWASAAGALVFVIAGVLVMNRLVHSPETQEPQGGQPSGTREGAKASSSGSSERGIVANSIAILPFKAQGDDSSGIWADGVPDDIRRHLSRVTELKVISRRSSEVFRNELKTAKEIAERLGARWLLVGTVHLMIGEKLSISVELTQGDEIKWSNKWNEVAFKDLLRVQEDIAREVARKMGQTVPPIQIASVDPARLQHSPRELRTNDSNRTRFLATRAEMPAQIPTENFRAWIAYLEGRQQWIKRTDEGLRQAREKFTQAVNLDANFALAHCYLAYVDMLMAVYIVERPEVVMPRAKRAAQRALRLNPQLGEAHAAMGYIQLLYDWDFAASRASFEKAIRYNPNHAFTYCWFSQYFQVMKDDKKRLELTQMAIEREPLNPVIMTVHAMSLKINGKSEEARALVERAIENHPGCALPLKRRALWHYADKEYAKALPLYRRVKALYPDRIWAQAGEVMCLLKLGEDKVEARATLDRILLEAGSGEADQELIPPGLMIWIHRNLDETEKSYRWVKHSVDHKYPLAAWLHSNDDDDEGFLPDRGRVNKILEPVGMQEYKAGLGGK